MGTISVGKESVAVLFNALPVVSRFLCPPDIPRRISSPTMVSAQTSSPRICKNLKINNRYYTLICIFVYGASLSNQIDSLVPLVYNLL